MPKSCQIERSRTLDPNQTMVVFKGCTGAQILDAILPTDTLVHIHYLRDTVVPIFPDTVDHIVINGPLSLAEAERRVARANAECDELVAILRAEREAAPQLAELRDAADMGTATAEELTELAALESREEALLAAFGEASQARNILDTELKKRRRDAAEGWEQETIDPPIRLPKSLEALFIKHVDSAFVASLPAFPPTLQRLIIDQSELTKVPTLPGSLHYFGFANNRIRRIPRINDNITAVDFHYNPLDEPFRTYYATYVRNRDIEQLRRSVNAWWDLHDNYRRLLHYKQGLVVKAAPGSGPNSPTGATLGTTFLPWGLPNNIAGYLSGESDKTLNQQIRTLGERLRRVGGKRKTRRTKRNKNSIRKK